MRADSVNFAAFNERGVKTPRYAVQISFDNANTDTLWLTSHPDTELPAGATSISNVLSDLSGTSQRIDPIKAVATIGSFNFKSLDPAEALTLAINAKLVTPELITNGTELSDTTGWTDTWSAINAVSGALRVTNDENPFFGKAYQGFTTVVGETYIVSVTSVGGTGSATWSVANSPCSGLVLTATDGDGVSSTYGDSRTFVATAALTYLCLTSGSNVNAEYYDYNYMSVKRIAALGLRHKRVQVYVGYQGLVWADYQLIQTQIIRSVDYHEGKYSFRCADIQRSARKEIFDEKKTNLKTTMDDSQTALTVYSTSSLETVFHGTSYSDSPSTTVGYVHIDEEIIRWVSKVETPISLTITTSFSGSNITAASGLDAFADKQMIVISGSVSNDGTYFVNGTPSATTLVVTATLVTETSTASVNTLAEIQLYNVTRGALNTKPVEHEIDTDADPDKREEVKELVYLELPLVKMLYAVLTGILYGDSASLPAHWHLGLSTAHVSTTSFVGIGKDWWDTTDDLAGFPARIVGMKKTKGKTFYEKELLLLIGAFLATLSDGQLALRRMNRTLATAPYLGVLDETNVVSHGALAHGMELLHNQFRINWNWDLKEEKLTRTYFLQDNSSISAHADAPVLNMNFKALDGSNHSQANLAVRTDSARDRYAGPPVLASVNCLHHMNKYEVGDVLLNNTPGVVDYNTGAAIDRAMEIQQVNTNWQTGDVVFKLFGSSQAASVEAYASSGTELADSFYGSGSGGTELFTELTGTYATESNGVLYIDTDGGVLTGNADMNAAGAIFYYEGGVQVNSGITLTINDNVKILARDGLTVYGTIDGTGNGLAASTDGIAGVFNTLATGQVRGFLSGLVRLWCAAELAVEGDGLPYYTLDNGSTTLTGIPTELRGSSGGDGGDYVNSRTVDLHLPLSQLDIIATYAGGAGGAGGAGLCVVSRGFNVGLAGSIDLSGVAGVVGASHTDNTLQGDSTVHAGSGGGGAPGGLLVILDGAAANETGLAAGMNSGSGGTGDIGSRLYPYWSGSTSSGKFTDTFGHVVHPHYEGFAAHGYGNAAYRVQYVPAGETAQADTPLYTTIPSAIIIQEVVDSRNDLNFAVLEISVTAPSDGNYRGSMLYIKLDGTSSYQQLGEVVGAEELIFYVPVHGSTYNVKAHPVSNAGVESAEFYGPVSHTTTNLQDPRVAAPPTSLALYSGAGELLILGDGTIITRIRVEWVAAVDALVNGYDVEFKKTADSLWTPGYSPNSGSLTEAYLLGVEDGVQYDVRIRSRNSSGAVSAWVTSTNHTVVGKTAPPSDVTTFLVQRQADGTREFSWTHTPPVDHAGYKLRFVLGTGGTWATMAALHEGLLTSSPFETNQLASGTYTVGIKAVDTSGNESTNALIVEATLGNPRIAGSLGNHDPRALGWPGTKTDCFVAEGNLYATDTKDWSDFATDVVTWAGWTAWARVPNSPIIYEHDTIDVGAITDFTPLVSVTSDATTILIEEEHSDDDVTYSPWATAGVPVNARYINIRVTLTDASALIELSQMYIILSADPVDEDIIDLDTSTLAACVSAPACSTSGYSIAAGHFRLPIVETYTTILSVNIVLQNVGSGWTWELLDKDVSVGPLIKIYNGSGTLADATIDAYTRGV